MKKTKGNNLTQKDVVLQALYELGGATNLIHLEDIALRSYQLHKGFFGWQLSIYKERGFPDKATVRYALKPLLNKPHKWLMTVKKGTNQSLWQFTDEGIRWYESNKERICGGLKKDLSDMRAKDTKKIEDRIQQSLAYRKFMNTGSVDSITKYEFADLLYISPDSHPRKYREAFAQLSTVVEVVKNKDFKRLRDALSDAAQFNHLFSEI